MCLGRVMLMDMPYPTLVSTVFYQMSIGRLSVPFVISKGRVTTVES